MWSKAVSNVEKWEHKEGCEQRRSATVPLSSGLTRWGFLSALGISGLRAEKRNMVRTRVTSSVWRDWLETHTTDRKTLSQVNTTKHWHKYTILYQTLPGGYEISTELPDDYYTVYVLVGAHQCGLVMFNIYTLRKKKSLHWQELMRAHTHTHAVLAGYECKPCGKKNYANVHFANCRCCCWYQGLLSLYPNSVTTQPSTWSRSRSHTLGFDECFLNQLNVNKEYMAEEPILFGF